MELTLERFADLVSEVVAELPAALQPYLERFEFDVSDAPPADDPDLGIAREVLPVAPGTRWGGTVISRITVYKAPFERAGSEGQLRDWLRAAVLDEITGGPDDEQDEAETEPRAVGPDLVGDVDIRG